MNTRQKKALYGLVLVIVFSIFSVWSANAHLFNSRLRGIPTYSSRIIPDIMAPQSKIEYISNDRFIILQGVLVQESLKTKHHFVDAHKKPGVHYEAYPDPIKGVIVTYASDGLILNIIFPEGTTNPLLIEKPAQP